MLGSRREQDSEKSAEKPATQKSLSLAERRDRRKQRRLQAAEEEATVEETEALEEDEELDEEEEEDDDAAAQRGYTPKKGVATRKQKDAIEARERETQSRAEKVPVLGGAVTYFRGVSAEVRKVTWPTREEATRLTQIVLTVTIAASIVLGLIDFFYGWWFQQGLENTATYLLVAAVFFPAAVLGIWYFLIREDES